ncbi:DUF6157 family protein [Gimibacter soli]|uniref:DUF6157 family protein n=1 Tax=Gimibacter soli TaxID=3024400 RepID=A0AAE9XUD6_9PROT|nr:DUF6157 family protein [Gimibacter soli]WCL53718.1 DUF6157 family protein [Gimibacter soli]
MSTNYYQSFITCSADCPAREGEIPAKPGTIAALQYDLLANGPYTITSDDLLFEVHAIRNGIAASDRDAEKAAFFSKPKACLRASPLVKQFGWGLHHDEEGRIALVGLGTETYKDLTSRADIKTVPGMRSKRT